MKIMKKMCDTLCLQIGISLLGTMAVNECINRTKTSLGYSNSIWAFFLCVVWFLGLRKAAAEFEEKRNGRLIPCFIFALLFMGSMAAGRQLEQRGEIIFSNWYIYGAVLVAAIAMTPIIEWVVWKLEISEISAKNSGGVDDKKPRSLILRQGGFSGLYGQDLFVVTWSPYFLRGLGFLHTTQNKRCIRFSLKSILLIIL